jgi:hypothetical protein
MIWSRTSVADTGFFLGPLANTSLVDCGLPSVVRHSVALRFKVRRTGARLVSRFASLAGDCSFEHRSQPRDCACLPLSGKEHESRCKNALTTVLATH